MESVSQTSFYSPRNIQNFFKSLSSVISVKRRWSPNFLVILEDVKPLYYTCMSICVCVLLEQDRGRVIKDTADYKGADDLSWFVLNELLLSFSIFAA